MPSRRLTFEDVKQAIIESLSPDLLEPKWRALVGPDDPVESGHCAVATEAYYHICGGREAGFMPVVCGYYADMDGNMMFGKEPTKRQQAQGWHKETHWWTRAPDDDGNRGRGDIHDVTVNQYPDPFPYENGRNTGFMQPQQIPSKRAQIVIDRVTAKLGKRALNTFKRENIKRYNQSQKKQARKQPRRRRAGMKR